MEIQISEELKQKLEKKIKETEFDSLEKYINYVLEQVVSDISTETTEQAYTEDEEQAMKERLRALGYV